MPARAYFGSDNQAPVHPQVFEALARANQGSALSYGECPWTQALEVCMRQHFGPHARAWAVFNGTGANVLGLASLLRPHEAVLCARGAHIEIDECGAPERFTQSKLIALETEHGKLSLPLLDAALHSVGDVHRVQPRVLSISNSTEAGTVYTPDEVQRLATWARTKGLALHIDGARLANAAAALGCTLGELVQGADVVSLGGTKNGLMGAEAVVALRPGLERELPYLRKQGMQLASKQRFLAAQLECMYASELWLSNARHANAMAARLAQALATTPGLHLSHPVQANAVFAHLDARAVQDLRQRWTFSVWDPSTGEVRWMCAWNTQAADVDAFAADIRQSVERFRAS